MYRPGDGMNAAGNTYGLSTVVALHCSGANSRQWSNLQRSLGHRYRVVTPEFYGCDDVGPWRGAHPFTIGDEAAPIIETIDRIDSPVHLVGHSYGGAVALAVALARPWRIASLALFEPTGFHLLKSMGPDGLLALREIYAVIKEVDRGVLEGAYARAACHFVDYWNGAGAWEAMKPTLQQGLCRYVPKASLDFRALLEAKITADDYRRLRVPTLIMQGEVTRPPAALIAHRLAHLIPAARRVMVAGAGHMGPLSHAAEVEALIGQHLESCADAAAANVEAA
jgi:pimeloyl-ACP methyl ester carboxylesterase